MAKRTLDSFFSPPSKKSKTDLVTTDRDISLPSMSRPSQGALGAQYVLSEPSQEPKYTSHASWPVPIRNLPDDLSEEIQNLLTTTAGKPINDQPHLDLLYFQPLIPQPFASQFFGFLRSSLPFYRVKYSISRFGKELQINTPRYTTVFGLDETSKFEIVSKSPSAKDPRITELVTRVLESGKSGKQVAPKKYHAIPRPIPPCLDLLRNLTEVLTGETYNFCLVNYYATGADSISYHSDDERFLGTDPAIASFSLGAKRDFYMKHKEPPKGSTTPAVSAAQVKLALNSGDMVLMRGETQANWLHSIPKRKGGEADKGRINITLRKAMIPGGTENYYRYNVGEGEVYRWNPKKNEMVMFDGHDITW